MKLAKKLSAITLASAIAVTSVPTAVFATEVPAEVAQEAEVVAQEAEVVAPEAEVVAPVIEEVVTEEIISEDARAGYNEKDVNDKQAALSEAVEKGRAKLADGKIYSASSKKALNDAIQDAECLLSAVFVEGINPVFTYTDKNGGSKNDPEGTYSTNLEEAKNTITNLGAADKLIELTDLVNAIEAAKKVDADAYTSATGSGTLADAIKDAEVQLNQWKYDESVVVTTGNVTAEVEKLDLEDPNKWQASDVQKVKKAVDSVKDIIAKGQGNYTKASYKALVDAVDAANAALKDTTSITPGNTLESDITSAKAALVDTTILKAELDEASEITESGDYTAASWKAFSELVASTKTKLQTALTDDTVVTYLEEGASGDLTDVNGNPNVYSDAKAISDKVNDLVSIKALKELVASTDSLVEDDYTSASWTAYLTALDTANTTLASATDPNNTTVTSTATEEQGLNSAVQNLVNVKELKDLVKEYVELKANSGDYVGWTDYSNQFTTLVDNNNNLVESTLTNNNAVKIAVDGIKAERAKLVKVSKTELNALVEKANAILANKDFYQDGTITVASVMTEIEEAVAKAAHTSESLESRIAALQTAIAKVDSLTTHSAGLASAIQTATSKKDKLMNAEQPKLQANIDAAQALVDAQEIDSEKLNAAMQLIDVTAKDRNGNATSVAADIAYYGEYVAATTNSLQVTVDTVKQMDMSTFDETAVANLYAKINAAEAVIRKTNPAATPAEINTAYDELLAAAAASKIDVKALTALYNEVKDYEFYAFEGDETDSTTPSPLYTFKVARDAAEEALKDADVVTVQQVYKALSAAKDNLVAVNKTTLSEKVKETKEKISGVNEAKYTIVELKKHSKDIALAEKVLAEATQNESKEIKKAQKDLLDLSITPGTYNYTPGNTSTIDTTSDIGSAFNTYYLVDSDASKYTKASWEKYVVARDNFAKAFLTLPTTANYTKDQITYNKTNDYVNRPETGRSMFIIPLADAHEALQEVGESTLVQLITEAKELYAKTEYTEESLKALGTAITEAEAAVAEGTPSLIVTASTKLENAMKALVKKDLVKDFILRIYKDIQGREGDAVDPEGLQYWQDQIAAGLPGSQVVASFILTPAFEDKNVSDEDFIKILYNVCLNKQVDAEGLEYWKGLLKYQSRKMVIATLTDTGAFKDQCKEIGLAEGNIAITIDDQVAGFPEGITNFVSGFYSKCLGRAEVDKGGLLYWGENLAKGTMGAKELAKSIIGSDEFIDKKYSDTDYIKVLYSSIVVRSYTDKEIDYWAGRLATDMTREEVLDNFLASPEFADFASDNGIKID